MTATLAALVICAAIGAGGARAAVGAGGARSARGARAARAAVGAGAARPAIVSSRGAIRWPYRTLQLGVLSGAGQAAAQQSRSPDGFRYAYLSGGVNTGSGWTSWAPGGGSYVSDYITESEAAHVVPVFSYYQLRESQPGSGNSDEPAADLENLRDRGTMRAYYEDLKLFFEKAAAASGPVVLQVEPDLWGYIEDAASRGNASTVAAAVASSGMPDLRGMPNTAAGFAQAILVLRNNYAPKVIVAYHDSSWGTGKNIQSSHPSDAEVAQMAAASVGFYRSLDAHFNAVFTDMSNCDAGYAQEVEGQGTTQWWSAIDFAHLGEYLSLIHRALHLPMVLWQIPVGTTQMRNTYGQYEDNKLQSLLDTGPVARRLLRRYAAAGVSALLFGPAMSGDTQVSRATLRTLAAYYRAGLLRAP